MYENNLFINDGIIYDTTNGQSIQCRCVNAIGILSVLEFPHTMIINRCNNSTGNRKIKLDGINGFNKSYFLGGIN